MQLIKVDKFEIGPGRPCLVVAEAGVNHNGDLDVARLLVDAAAEARADAVKFQTFKTENVVSRLAQKAEYQMRTKASGESQFDMVKSLELPPRAHRELMAHCRNRGILFLSTPFDEESADFLDNLGVAAFKIPSGEITNLDLVQHVARKGRPMLVSTGMSCLGDVEAAVQAAHQAGNTELVLLHCVSNYPADPVDVNLRAMTTLAQAFDIPVGYSDHTTGIEIALAAVAMGACVVEKHFTLDRTMKGPDHMASLEPPELAALVRGIRNVELALGTGRKMPAAAEAGTAAVARRSLFVVVDVAEGVELTLDMVAALRPGTGLSPSLKSVVVGRRARRAIPAGTMLDWEMLS